MTRDSLSRDEVEGAWRRLCASVLAHSAFVLAEGRGRAAPRNKQAAYSRGELRRQREAAKAWLDGGPAVLSFAEACGACDLDPVAARSAVERFLDNPDPTLRRQWKFAGAAARTRTSRAIKEVARNR